MALFDALTGLPNRHYFDEVLKKEITLVERKGHESCLVMLRGLCFQRHRQRIGLPAGDSILLQLGGLLSASIGVARLSGSRDDSLIRQ